MKYQQVFFILFFCVNAVNSRPVPTLPPAVIPQFFQITDLTGLASILCAYGFELVKDNHMPLSVKLIAQKKDSRQSHKEQLSKMYYEDPIRYVRAEVLESGFYFVQTRENRGKHYFELTNMPETPFIKSETRVEHVCHTSIVRDLSRVIEIIQKFVTQEDER